MGVLVPGIGFLTALYPWLLIFALIAFVLAGIGLMFVGWLQLAILAVEREKLLFLLFVPLYIVLFAVREWPNSRRGVMILAVGLA